MVSLVQVSLHPWKGLSVKLHLACTPNIGKIQWSPSVKINFDGAIFQESGEVGIGVVVWKSQGLVMAFMAKKIILPHSVANVEAKAAVRALRFA